MALGSWLISKWMYSKYNPLKIYAYLEILIGIYSILVFSPLLRVLFDWCGVIYQYQLFMGTIYGLFVKFLCCASLLLLPAMLMGATFPAMVLITKKFKPSIGSSVALSYSINSGGAVFGSITMAFLLLPWFGMQANLMLCGIASSVIGIICLVISPKLKSFKSSLETNKHSPVNLLKLLLLTLIFLEGILGFSLEIAWTRFFALVFGSSTYSFATMLSALILGIALGSLILNKLDAKIEYPIFYFGLTQILMGFCLMFSLSIYPYLPVFFNFLHNSMVPSQLTYTVYESLKFLISFSLMLLPTLFGGMSLPLVIKAVVRNDNNIAEECGLVYASDTIGNVTGALIAALLLMPLLGIQYLLILISLGCVILGFTSLMIANKFEHRRSIRLYLVIILGFLLIASQLILDNWKLEYFAIVPTRRSSVVSWSKLINKAEETKVLFSNDDPSTSIMVIENRNKTRAILNNGKPDASDKDDMNTQLLLGHIPLVINPQIKDVGVIGLGSGVTASAILRHQVDSLHVIELTKAMVEAQKYFSHVNFNFLDDERVKLTLDDARSVLSFDNKKYDVIVSEPSNPWQAGVAKLFTEDFYELIKNRLSPDGFFVQWLQLYGSNDTLFTSSIRTLRAVFPYLYGFRSQSGDFIILCSMKFIELKSDNIKLIFENQNLLRHFSQRSWSTPRQFFTLQTHTPQSLDALASLGSFVNNSDNLFLEHRAPKATFMKHRVRIISKLSDFEYQSPALLFNSLLNKPYYANINNSFKKHNPHLSRFVNSAMIASHYNKTHILKEKIDIIDRVPTFPFYEYSELEKILFIKAEEKKWGEFLKVWTNYKDSLILFLASDIQLRGLWKQKVAEWLESKPIEPVTLSLLRFTFNLEAYDKNLSRVTTLFDAYMDTDNHIFSTQLISAVCQFFPPRQCIRMKEKVLKNNPNHPVGSLTKFPRNMWSLPN